MKTTRKIQSSLILLALSFSAVLNGGCSALPRHEHVVGDIRTSDNGLATVCLQGKLIKPGSAVEIFESSCKRSSKQKRWSKISRIECNDQKVSNAKVLSSSNIHEVTLEVENPNIVKAGSFIKIN